MAHKKRDRQIRPHMRRKRGNDTNIINFGIIASCGFVTYMLLQQGLTEGWDSIVKGERGGGFRVSTGLMFVIPIDLFAIVMLYLINRKNPRAAKRDA